MKNDELTSIARRIDELKLHQLLMPYNWALRPEGTALPYFCFVFGSDQPSVKFRIAFFEGWQTMHDYLRIRIDSSWSFFLSPMELNHYSVLFTNDGNIGIFRNETGYLPRALTSSEELLIKKLLWEVYGMMLRVESDKNLIMSYASDEALFSRRELKDGSWVDEALKIVPMRSHVERVEYSKGLMSKVKDLPIKRDKAIDLDLRLVVGKATKEPRPRLIYELIALETSTRARFLQLRTSMNKEAGLRGIWEGMPAALLEAFKDCGYVPGEIRVCSQRVFRLLRPLTLDLPFKLSLHNSLAL